MEISIENKKGSTRSGTDKDGHEWHTEMHYDYGYIRGTVGVDKDHLDAYIGPNPESEIVYIVNQNDPVTNKFDEQKVMLGFNTEAEAKDAYLKQYDRPGFFGDILKMDIDTFKEEAFDKKNKGKCLKKTRERAYGVDLDYVLDFIEYCNHGKAAMGCWPAMADKWLAQDKEITVSAGELVQAAYNFVEEQGSRSIQIK
jgi:hypothetical protein